MTNSVLEIDLVLSNNIFCEGYIFSSEIIFPGVIFKVEVIFEYMFTVDNPQYFRSTVNCSISLFNLAKQYWRQLEVD